MELSDAAAVWDGLSWACWWLEDGYAAIRARERAYGLYKNAGDRRGAARMAIWLANDHGDFRGEEAVAQGWLRRAARILDESDAPVLHEEGVLEALTREAGLTPREAAYVEVVEEYPDLETLVRGYLAHGSIVKAVRSTGELHAQNALGARWMTRHRVATECSSDGHRTCGRCSH